MKDTRYSIVTKDMSKCYICGKSPTHIHEIFFGTANRKKSIEDGLCVGLCPAHHNMSGLGVHFNKQLDLYLKKIGEECWIKEYSDDKNGERDFINRFGKNYL